MCSRCPKNPIPGLEFDANCRLTFWAEAPLCLLSNFTLIPRDNMTLEEKMNAITRIVLVVWILLLLFGSEAVRRKANLFLIIILVVIVLLYYARKRRLQQELMARVMAKMVLDHQSTFDLNKSRQHRHQQTVQSDSRDSDDESSGSDSDSHRSHHRYETRNSHQKGDMNGEFTRFEATAGKGQYAAQSTSNQHPQLAVKQTKSASSPPKERQEKEHVEEEDEPNEEEDEAEPDMEPEVVESRRPIVRKSADRTKRNPRKPYPPVVSPSMEVKASRQENLMRAYRGPDPKLGSKFHGYQTKNFQDDEGPSIRYTTRRLRGANTSPVVTQSRPTATEPLEDRYEVMAENDDAESDDDDEQQNNIQDQEEANVPEIEEPIEVQQVMDVPRKRTFLPANYDGFSDFVSKPVVQTDRPKLTRHGAMKGRRLPAQWGDSNQTPGRTTASDLMFGRAAKLEKQTNARLRAQKGSQINSMYGI